MVYVYVCVCVPVSINQFSISSPCKHSYDIILVCLEWNAIQSQEDMFLSLNQIHFSS